MIRTHVWHESGGFGRQAMAGRPATLAAAAPPGFLGAAPLKVNLPEAQERPLRLLSPHGLYGATPRLGQSVTAAEWYERARRAIAKYQALQGRVAQIANKTSRAEILAWIGTPSNTSSIAYRYATVVSDSTQDVAREGVGAYNVERRQNRIMELEELNEDLEAKINQAEQFYGTLPAPVTQVKEVRVPGETGADYTIPIIAAGGAVALALLLTQL